MIAPEQVLLMVEPIDMRAGAERLSGLVQQGLWGARRAMARRMVLPIAAARGSSC